MAAQVSPNLSARPSGGGNVRLPVGPKVLRIGIIQGARIVEERLVRKRETVTIGQSTKNMFVIPTEALPKTFALFEITPHGYMLNIPDASDGRVSIGDQVVSVAQLKDGTGSVKAQRRGTVWAVQLDERARGKLAIGDATVLFQFVTPPPPQPRPQLPASVRGSLSQAIDWTLAFLLGGSLLAHFGFVAYLRSQGYTQQANIEEIPDRFVKMIVKDVPKLDVIPAPELPQQPTQGAEPAPQKKLPQRAAGGGDGKKAGPKGPGKSEEQLAREAAEKRAALGEQVARMGVLKVLGAKGEGGNVADVLKGGDPGGDQERAFADIGGVGMAKGGEGVGLRGVKGGLGGGGGTGRAVGIGDLRAAGVGEGGTGAKTSERAVRAVVQADAIPDVDGTLDPKLIAKEMRSRMGAIKLCYERSLKRNPQLGGKIVVRFEISSVGKVTKIEAEQDTMQDKDVFNCIRDTMSRWHLPAPQGGAAQVAFPFVFHSSQ